MDLQQAMRLGAWLAFYGTGDLEYITNAGSVALHFCQVVPDLAIIDPKYNQAIENVQKAMASIGIETRWLGYTSLALEDKEGRRFLLTPEM